jgi:hypothetical protein
MKKPRRPYIVTEAPTIYYHVFHRNDGYYFYDPSEMEDGPYPTAEIAQAARVWYLENIF